MNEPTRVIAEAFSRTAARYDAFALDHPHQERIRQKIYAHLERQLPPGSRILELNAGTGIDAAALARRGYFIHATDIAEGMVQRIREKVRRQGLEGRVTVQQCSFTRLEEIPDGPYDAVFSNLGGLNCIPDPSVVVRSLDGLLAPGGLAILVLMPPVCLWEMAEVLRGHPRLAFRRFARGGTRTHLEGLYFTTYYFTPRQALGWFGDSYRLLAIEGISVLTPTLESKRFARRYPGLYRRLAWLDDRLSPRRPWYGWGDFFLIALRKVQGRVMGEKELRDQELP